MYNFTVLACQLNEPEENIAPTDSRLRPDQRLMEEGNLDEANNVKVQLEEKQRQVRRQREAEAEVAAREGRPYPPYEPVWFKKDKDPITGNPIHIYQVPRPLFCPVSLLQPCLSIRLYGKPMRPAGFRPIAAHGTV